MDDRQDPEEFAFRLIALAHRCVDWQVWGGSRVARYWDALGDRIRISVYAGPKLADFWGRLATQMSLGDPPTMEERAELDAVLHCGADRAVLGILAKQHRAIILRLRVENETRKAARASARADIDQEGML